MSDDKVVYQISMGDVYEVAAHLGYSEKWVNLNMEGIQKGFKSIDWWQTIENTIKNMEVKND
jgi:hypothetical protein